MQQTDDEQDSSEADRGGLELCRRDGLSPSRVGFEARREQDVGEEDEVVGHVHQHDEALACPRVGAEHVGRVALAEPFDERSEPERQGDEPDEGHQFEYPPVHDEVPFLVFGCGHDGRQGGADETCDNCDPTAVQEHGAGSRSNRAASTHAAAWLSTRRRRVGCSTRSKACCSKPRLARTPQPRCLNEKTREPKLAGLSVFRLLRALS